MFLKNPYNEWKGAKVSLNENDFIVKDSPNPMGDSHRQTKNTFHRDSNIQSPKRSLEYASKNAEEEFEVKLDSTEDAIQESLKIVMPTWSLQNSVAVNPFWNYRKESFYKLSKRLSKTMHQPLLMPLDYYREKFDAGEITLGAIERVLEILADENPKLSMSLDEWERLNEREALTDQVETFAEYVPTKLDYHQIAVHDISKHCAAYFDDMQALVRYPWQSGMFWDGFFESLEYDVSMEQSGISGFAEVAKKFKHMTPEKAIEQALIDMGIKSISLQALYLQRILVHVIGWGSQFQQLEWQRGLGHKPARKSRVEELLAVALIYDYCIFQQVKDSNQVETRKWLAKLESSDHRIDLYHPAFLKAYVWQAAFELSHQTAVAAGLARQLEKPKAIDCQMVFCIDVRSEMLRRHIEQEHQGIQTIGAAGFFGVPVNFQNTNERYTSERLPALLKSGFAVRNTKDHKNRDLSDDMVMSYFKNLRKSSFSSFLYVEFFGILSVANLAKKTLKSLTRKRAGDVPEKFTQAEHKDAELMLFDSKAEKLASLDDQAGIAKGILDSIGLKKEFGELVVLAGHGAQTTNNAFESSLDCGACGGHPGDVNARLAAQLLNDHQVRIKLLDLGYEIPEMTWFVAAVHETVTDEVYILDRCKIPEYYQPQLLELTQSLKSAARLTRSERLVSRSDILDPSASRRSSNWSEVRPEWGLSGNACFIIAPRARSKGMNLASRSFLHDYDWKNDLGFKRLEAIMTAPMVVTNWINMQYFASVVAPDQFSSGSKILHNLTNESYVVEGNGGDLRFGLTHESVSDGKKFIHDPLRLSVFIEAPQTEIEKIISKHEVLRDLIDNYWLHILQIDSASGEVFRRSKGGFEKL